MRATTLLVSFLLAAVAASAHVHNALETEMFAIPISPNLFNWTYQEFDQQYRFHASLQGKPELPSWLRYIYSGRHHSGFIFGTPPRGTISPITLEVIGLNRQDYETRRVQLTLNISPKQSMALHEVELKIDNLNVEDLLDEHRMTSLKEILKTKLWVESSQDLYTTFLASAIDMGARLPLRPSDGEGLVVRLGSVVPFSSQLKWLREEVRPLSRLPICPREFKRTTSEKIFRVAGFILDWCNFELYNTIYKERSTEHLEYLTEIPNTSKTAKSVKALSNQDVWSAPSKRALPMRSYTKQLTAAVAVPLLLLLLSIAALTAVLCFHYAAIYYMKQLTAVVAIPLLLLLLSISALIALFSFHYVAIGHKSEKVEICRFGTGNTDQTQVADNSSAKSVGVSPNNSLARPYSPRSTSNLAGNYNRPQPPPYIGSNTNSLHHRRSANIDKTPTTSGHTPEHRTHLLEESLKLLNDAKLNTEFDLLTNQDPIVDFADGTDDYVPIKPDGTGFVGLKSLDDINVPDLTKFGVGPI